MSALHLNSTVFSGCGDELVAADDAIGDVAIKPGIVDILMFCALWPMGEFFCRYFENCLISGERK